MILYALLVTTIICGFLGFKGVGEIYFLHSIGIDLLNAFETTIKSSGSETAIKGSLVFGILVIQPISFALIFLKILDKIVIGYVVEKINSQVPISARNVEQKEGWLKKIGINKNFHKRENHNKDISIDISSIDDKGNVMASWAHPSNPLKEPYEFYIIDFIEYVIIFRGSKIHILLVILSPIIIISLCFFRVTLDTGFTTFACLVICFGPSYILYTTVLAWFAIANGNKWDRFKNIKELSEVLARIGETRLNKYCFQSNEYLYDLFLSNPRLKSILNRIPIF